MIDIDSISINDIFWLRFKRDINFRIQGLPPDIHFTISRHPDSTDMNLHITRNIVGLERKPSIKIAIIAKDLVEDIGITLSHYLASLVFESVNIKIIKKRYPDLFFMDESRAIKTKRYLKSLRTLVEPHYSVKKRKLKFTGDFEVLLNEYANKERESFKKDIRFSYRFTKMANWAFLETQNPTVVFRKINTHWYRVKQDIPLNTILKRLVGEQLACHFTFYIANSINTLAQAMTYNDVAEHDKPIRLIRKEKA